MTAIWVWFVSAASYLILAGQVSHDEVVAAVVFGAAAAAWHRALLDAGARRYAFDVQAIRAIAKAVAGLPRATLQVGRWLAVGLIRPVDGQRVERVFAGGRQERPRDAGRRAVVVLATSLSPDAYVLRVPLDEDTVLTHSVAGQGPSGDPRWPA